MTAGRPRILPRRVRRRRAGDLLFSAPLADGRDAFVYVLVEHQSSTDELMAFRLLRYITRIWDRFLEEHPRSRRLPAVIPLVVHQGPGRWDSPRQLLDLVDLGPAGKKAMEELLPRFGYLLDDLGVLDRQRLRERTVTPQVRVAFMLLKFVPGNPGLAEEWRKWDGDLRAALDGPAGTEVFSAMLTYIVRVGEVPETELRDLVASLGPDAEEAYVTTAEMLEARGEAKSVLRILKNRSIPVDDRSRARIIACTDVETLDTWLDRSLTVAEVTDLFAE